MIFTNAVINLLANLCLFSGFYIDYKFFYNKNIGPLVFFLCFLPLVEKPKTRLILGAAVIAMFLFTLTNIFEHKVHWILLAACFAGFYIESRRERKGEERSRGERREEEKKIEERRERERGERERGERSKFRV